MFGLLFWFSLLGFGRNWLTWMDIIVSMSFRMTLRIRTSRLYNNGNILNIALSKRTQWIRAKSAEWGPVIVVMSRSKDNFGSVISTIVIVKLTCLEVFMINNRTTAISSFDSIQNTITHAIKGAHIPEFSDRSRVGDSSTKNRSKTFVGWKWKYCKGVNNNLLTR